MIDLIDARLNQARELLQAARDEFARAEEAKGGAAVIGLRNSCGKGWLALRLRTVTFSCRVCRNPNCPRTTGADIISQAD